MAMLSVYKKIFKHMLSGNLNEVFNFRLFASFNLPELLHIFQSIHLEVILSIHGFLVGKFWLNYQTTISVRIISLHFMRSILWYHC